MRVQLQCYSVERGTRRDNDEPFTVALFLDTDPDDKLSAFLKYSGEDVERIRPGVNYVFSLTGLSPAKGDKSSYYIRGKLVYDEQAQAASA